MIDNPLIGKMPAGGGKVGIDRLQAYCVRLNRMNWVRLSGRPYFITEWTDEDGEARHKLDRNG